MATCATCGTTILFGGREKSDLRFCNDTCLGNGAVLTLAQEIPEDVVRNETKALHESDCPQCQGPGPVDVHVSYWIWSALLLTSSWSKPKVSCRSCGRSPQIAGVFVSFLFGWWGFPWGIIMTPIQLVRGISASIGGPDPSEPSEKLHQQVRLLIAARMMGQGSDTETAQE